MTNSERNLTFRVNNFLKEKILKKNDIIFLPDKREVISFIRIKRLILTFIKKFILILKINCDNILWCGLSISGSNIDVNSYEFPICWLTATRFKKRIWRDGWVGLRRTPGKCVNWKQFRGFESLSLRQKKALLLKCFFQLNPSCDGINLLTQMKSLRDEIRLYRDIKTDLISSKPKGFDFTQTCLDFIVNKVNDFIKTNDSKIISFLQQERHFYKCLFLSQYFILKCHLEKILNRYWH